MGIARGGCSRDAAAAAAAAAWACAAGPARTAEEVAVDGGAETEYECVVWDLAAEEDRLVVEGGACWRKALKKPERKKGRCVEGAMVPV